MISLLSVVGYLVLAPSQTALRQVWTLPPSATPQSISADGRYVSYVDWTAGNLAAYDVAEQDTHLVTRNVTWAEPTGGSNEESVISPDGSQIAYSWLNEAEQHYDLRLINRDGSGLGPEFSGLDGLRTGNRFLSWRGSCRPGSESTPSRWTPARPPSSVPPGCRILRSGLVTASRFSTSLQGG